MKLRNINIRKIIRFQFIAWIGTLVNLAILWLLHGRLEMAVPVAGAIAIELAIIHNFTWHYFVTWNTR
ncbi:MAG TPA: GtrA family protein, partial [bacterium]|nr:GtrA family protein [bacterium]